MVMVILLAAVLSAVSNRLQRLLNVPQAEGAQCKGGVGGVAGAVEDPFEELSVLGGISKESQPFQ